MKFIQKDSDLFILFILWHVVVAKSQKYLGVLQVIWKLSYIETSVQKNFSHFKHISLKGVNLCIKSCRSGTPLFFNFWGVHSSITFSNSCSFQNMFLPFMGPKNIFQNTYFWGKSFIWPHFAPLLKNVNQP